MSLNGLFSRISGRLASARAPRGNGPRRMGPTFSNRRDCRRYGCQETPWNWGSHWVLERAGLTGRETVVDLGAGENPILLPALRAQAGRAVLVDSEFLPGSNLGSNIDRVMADIGNLPLANESIDVAISVSVLEHLSLDRRDAAMREIARVLKPGGRAALSIGIPLGARPEDEALMATIPFLADRGCGVFMPVDIRHLLDATDALELVDSEGLEHCPGFAEFDEDAILADAEIVRDRWGDFPELAAHPGLAGVEICELGLYLERRG